MSRLSDFSAATIKHTDPLVLAIVAAALIAMSLLAVDYLNSPHVGQDSMKGMLDASPSDSATASTI